MAEKPRAVIIVGALAVAIAAIAAYFLYNYLQTQEKKVSEAVASETIVVADTEIPVGSTINATQVKKVTWPKASMPQGAFLSTEQVVGRVAIQTLMLDDPIIEAKLIPKEGSPGILTYKIPEGHRAMTVGVDQVAGVAGFINPGNMVDVVLTTTPSGTSQAISKIVLQNVPVLAIAQTVENREGKAVIVPTVTMDVTPEDTEKLAIASSQGKLQLVLRRVGDQEVTKTTGATVTKVISGATVTEKPKATQKARVTVAKKEEAIKPPVAVTCVDVWRGSKKVVETFKAE